MFITSAAHAEAVGRAHGTAFGSIRPAATMIVVAGLLDPRWHVEIEAEAVVHEPMPERGSGRDRA
jgi:enamine deaminase RidA (YjgF/YER057c/UK114 family)